MTSRGKHARGAAEYARAMLEAELRAAQAVVNGHAQQRETRDTLVRTAVRQGWTHAAIAKTTGLSRGRINQIARGRR